MAAKMEERKERQLIPKVIIILMVSFSYLYPDNQDSLYTVNPPPDSQLTDDMEDELQKYSAGKAALFSGILPGLGQAYCRRRVRGGVGLASFLTASLVSLNYTNSSKTAEKEFLSAKNEYLQYKEIADSVSEESPVYSETHLRLHKKKETYLVDKYEMKKEIHTAWQAGGWSLGIYLWNIMDALECSNRFYDQEPRNPAKAALLSAIPFLGLGQIYNHSYAKAGVIWTTQTMLLTMSINKIRLMNLCEKRINTLKRMENDENSYYTPDKGALSAWESRYDNSFRRRNTYLWFFVLFYFYGITDAAVDAHLHDFEEKIKITPEFTGSGGGISLTILFGSWE